MTDEERSALMAVVHDLRDRSNEQLKFANNNDEREIEARKFAVEQRAEAARLRATAHWIEQQLPKPEEPGVET